MEALRNYVQHRGIPVHWTYFNRRWNNFGKEQQLMFSIFSIEVGSTKSYLLEDGNFKKKVLDEIPDEVDLKATTRKYVEGISRVHSNTRKLVEQSLDETRSIIENARSFQEVWKKKQVAICS